MLTVLPRSCRSLLFRSRSLCKTSSTELVEGSTSSDCRGENVDQCDLRTTLMEHLWRETDLERFFLASTLESFPEVGW